jgi:ferric-dicitrate binding protein FerR (iron transport regulator)
MNDQKENNPDFRSLARYLAGESTPEEAMEVDDWILHSEKNRQLFEQVCAAWQGAAEDIPPQVRRLASLRKLRIYGMGIAASLLILFGGLWLFVRSPEKKSPSPIASAGTSYITKQASAEILRDTLADNSIVVQNTNSTLRYASDFNTRNRELQLAGEAWFDITSNPAKPFLINIGTIRVVVLGTTFNVRQSSATIEVSVKKGSVMMFNDSDSLIVTTGRKGIYLIRENRFVLLNSFNGNEQGYATRILTFENIPLKEIAAQIEKAYGVAVVFRDEKLKELTMSSTFDNDPITYIFDVISVTLHVNYKIENKVVYISGA